MNVLLVDDQEDVRLLERMALLRAGVTQRIAEAESVAGALVEIEANCPDLVVLDVMMPGMSGLEGLPELRRMCPEARIVICSSSFSLEIPDGADDVIPKSSDLVDSLVRLALSLVD